MSEASPKTSGLDAKVQLRGLLSEEEIQLLRAARELGCAVSLVDKNGTVVVGEPLPELVLAAPPEPSPAQPSETPVLTQDQSTLQVTRETPKDESQSRPLPRDEPLIERSMQMARLASEIDRQAQAYAKRPKRKFISANTREYAYANYMVPPNYDSMIGKIIVHGDTRDQALARMRTALSETVIEGISTNIPLHRELMADAKFIEGGTSIHYLEGWLEHHKR